MKIIAGWLVALAMIADRNSNRAECEAATNVSRGAVYWPWLLAGEPRDKT
jgi:hypothetical protein